ncbi:CHASE3 domain-containing protein [Sphingomonas yunnanensis]|uniref:methyl-accepting chemotaxis protein n=1 Tax=Sphingomonas yunnanensis TaxID=310400 RepID=UPI001CA7A248|nr:methyl-accepting chemotaxis protein [Sphingomonas yunnanensis]MBY9062147.1 CHASE3 domain-containing protein [Sphingomonas yunnanensis]
MSIPRKLAMSFFVIIGFAAVMLAVFFTNVWMIRDATEGNNRAQTIYAKALTLETSLLRENSQLRGYLVTGDKSYLKSYDEARTEYDRAAAELGPMLTDPTEHRLFETGRGEAMKWRRDWSDRLVAMVKAGKREAAEQVVRDAGKAVLTSAAILPLRDVRDRETEAMQRNAARQEKALTSATVALIVGGLLLIAVAATLAVVLGRSIARPITALTRRMADLANGKLDITVPAERRDELGDMARAVIVFRDAARAKLTADTEREQAMAAIGEGLRRLADADLTVRLTDVPRSFERIAHDFNGAVGKLSDLTQNVRGSVHTIKRNADEISQSARALSGRSEQQAASLRETAAAMDEITATVRTGATNAANANDAMADARVEAEQGGAVVRKSVQAMNGIDQASREIADIISVIDGIAFQTNLLALNAGVEAARAGDAGRGFAVVASEVRALAQRSAEAASDVKSRILSAIEHVQSGVELVDATGKALDRIIDRVVSVSTIMGTIARSADDQAQSLGQVNIAIGEMDSVTQQNAAMVEESTAASQMLAHEAEQLASAVAIFTVEQAAPTPAPRTGRSTHAPAPASRQPTVARAARGPIRLVGKSATVSKEDDWSSF